MDGKDAGTTVIAIAGGSCSGKTSLAKAVAARVPSGSEAIIIPLDSYYHDLSDVALDMRAAHNFDHPDSIDLDLFEHDLARLAVGKGAFVPVYDYATHTQKPRGDWRSINPRNPDTARYLVVEGLHVLYRENARALYDLGVFIDIDLNTCLRRRIERDVRERGRTPEGVTEQFEKTVIPMFETFVLPCRRHADITVDGTTASDRSAAAVISAIGRRRSY